MVGWRSALTVLLIRHAHAGEREDWAGDDRARPLSALGRSHAEALPAALAPALRDEPLQRIVSSPFRRCVQTVEPLAAAHALTVEDDAALAEGNPGAAVALVQRAAASTWALCTHGDIVPAVLQALADDGMPLPPRPRWAKGSTWLLRVDGGGRFVQAEYVPVPDV